MKLQPESARELRRISLITAICTILMWAVFFALHLAGITHFDKTVVSASLIGALIAIGNFAGICFSVQQAIEEKDEKKRRALLKVSYNTRTLLQAVWIIVAVAAPCFQAFAGILPLLFPRVAIYLLQACGKYKPEKLQSYISESKNADNQNTGREPDSREKESAAENEEADS